MSNLRERLVRSAVRSGITTVARLFNGEAFLTADQASAPRERRTGTA